MKNIVMLLSNAFRPDPRVEREAVSLVKSGKSVTVIAWDREAVYPLQENWQGVNVLRVQNVRSAYGSGWRQFFYTPRFWRAAIRAAINQDPAAVHCHDLDTLYAGVQIKKKTGCALLYDAHEDYPALMSLYLPGPMVTTLAWLEKKLLREVDYTLTASSVFADKLRNTGVHPVTTLGNYQDLESFNHVTPQDTEKLRQELGIEPDRLVVSYIGGFTRNRELIPLIEAADLLPAVQFLLWGDGHQRAAVESAASSRSNVRYLGWLPPEKVPPYTCMSDIIYYCLRSDYPGAVYNAPNTLSNAMAAGTPIIANDVGDLGRIVKETGCGVLLEEVTPGAIQNAVEILQNPDLRSQTGAAGRKAAEEKYNWSIAAERLNQIYDDLI